MARTKTDSSLERERRIRLYRRNGYTLTEIATLEGISRPRVSQIIAAAHAELPEEETRAEIASLLEFAERKAVEVVNDPGYICGPTGRVVEGPDGEPLQNKGIVVDALKTVILVAEKRARLYAADKPQKSIVRHDVADQQRAEAMAAIAAARQAELQQREAIQRELEAYRRQAGRTIAGEILPPAIEG